MSQVNDVIYFPPRDIELASNVDNLEFSSAYMHLQATGAYNITGLQAVVPGDHLVPYLFFKNESAYNITFKHLDSSSNAENQIVTLDGLNLILAPTQLVKLEYIASKFRVVRVENY
jgi:hypothetical protein